MAKRKSPPLPKPVASAVREILRHERCLSEKPEREEQEGSDWLVTVNWAVELNFRGKARQKSKKGVRPIEPVTFVFRRTYPMSAPVPRLRGDFPRSFPHIQPRRSNIVEPCISDADLDETFSREGLSGLLFRLSDWLNKAGTDQLMNESQGWEPTRRDTLQEIIVADISKLRDHAATHSGRITYLAIFDPMASALEGTDIPCVQVQQIGEASLELDGIEQTVRRYEAYRPSVIALFSAEGMTPCENFLNADIASAQDILNEAALLGLDAPVRKFCADLAEAAPGFLRYPIAIVLAAKRPMNLIGEATSIELIPYVTRFDSARAAKQDYSFTAAPARLLESVTPTLLRRFSGVDEADERRLILVGVGSLGSKIAMHETRRGAAPSALIDNRSFLPHNAARHALVPPVAITDNMDDFHAFGGLPSKAASVMKLVERFGGASPLVLPRDVADVLADKAKLKDLYKHGESLTLVTTGSRRVRSAICRKFDGEDSTRLAEAFLTASGKLGAFLVEGPNRNPDLIELFALWMAQMRDDAIWREWESSDAGAHRVATGQGCGSETVTATDAAISLMAASMNEMTSSVRKGHLASDTAALFYGRKTEFNLDWSHQTPEAFLRVKCKKDRKDGSRWRVCVSTDAVAKIQADLDRWPNVETGGYLVGHREISTKRLIVVNIIEAPEGSVREAGRFNLAPLPDDFSLNDAGGYFEIVGTWHRHLGDVTPSRKDELSAAQLSADNEAPLAMLVTNGTDWKSLITKE